MEVKICTRCLIEQPLTNEYFKWLKASRYRKTARFDSWCRECYRQRSKEYLKTHPDHRRSRDAAYRARTLNHRRAYAKKYGREYNSREAVKRSRHASHQLLKRRCFEAYQVGREIACECCNENVLNFLTLDHSRNDGKTHRAELGGRRNGPGFYKWLEKNGFPQDLGLRILCQNCNWSRHWTPEKTCPHELARQQLLPAGAVRLNLAA